MRIKAVLDGDLEGYLKSLGCYKQVVQGQVHCAFCKEIITYDNLLALFPLNGAIHFCCENFSCGFELAQTTGARQGKKV